MTASTLILLGLALSALRFLGGLLLGQQLKGSIPDYTAARARVAARQLPDGLAEKYEGEWLATLEALTDKPISAIKYAHGLRRAANSISGERTHNRKSVIRNKVTRVADTSLGLLLLLLLAPLVGTATIAAKVSGGDRILTREPAFGIHSRRIYLLKFTFTYREDRRLSKVGRFFYRAGLAELPLLVNVIRGEIAFIGPPIRRVVGVKMTPPQSPVLPGLMSWQRMARAGYIDLGTLEARARDERRTLRGDLALVLRWPLFVVSGAELSHYSGSQCDCTASVSEASDPTSSDQECG